MTTPEEKEKALQETIAKLDSNQKLILEMLGKITPKQDAEEPDPKQDSLDKDSALFKVLLKDTLPEKKLDSMSHDELRIALELLPQIKPAKGVEIPASKTDNKEDTRAYFDVPEVA
jgi:hypothetical protein